MNLLLIWCMCAYIYYTNPVHFLCQLCNYGIIYYTHNTQVQCHITSSGQGTLKIFITFTMSYPSLSPHPSKGSVRLLGTSSWLEYCPIRLWHAIIGHALVWLDWHVMLTHQWVKVFGSAQLGPTTSLAVLFIKCSFQSFKGQELIKKAYQNLLPVVFEKYIYKRSDRKRQ